MKIRKSHGLAILVVVAVAVAAVAVNIASRTQSQNAQTGNNGRRGGGTKISVKTMEVEKTTLHGYVSTNGEIESQNSVSVFPDVAGKIMSVSVMLGSSVKKGDVLGYVDPSTPGSYFKQSPVYAPISGSIISTPLKNGTTVSTNSVVCIIGDINNLQVTASVPERYVSVLKTGLKADVLVEAYPDEAFRATVSRISPVIDSASRTKQVVLHFDKNDERINAGMFAKVILFTEDYSDFVVMPRDSLVQNGEKYYAYVVNHNSTVSKREIQLGKNVDGMVQITSGIKEGERVVIQGQTSLADGSNILDIGESAQNSQSEKKSRQKNDSSAKKDGTTGGARGQNGGSAR